MRFGAPPLARLAGKRSRVSSPRPLSGSNPTALGPPYEKGPVAGALCERMVLSVGFEPATFRSGGERSIQLS